MRYPSSIIGIALAAIFSCALAVMPPALDVVMAASLGRPNAAIGRGGGGLIGDGLSNLENVAELPSENHDIRETVRKILNYIISFVALAAVLTIVIAGFVLIFGLGSEASTGKAKKIILYTILGIVVIYFVRVIVAFFTQDLASQFP